jgi:cytochrome bd-type quinol oxidase subunit 1
MIGLIAVCFFFTSTGQADDHLKVRGWFEREGHHHPLLFGKDDEGNETAGQMAAWLLVAANLPVVMSVLIKWTNKVVPMGNGLKDVMARFNRFQKKHLMRLHYLINPLVLGIALWHWLSSRCRSTALPEWGLVMMVALIALGLIVKYRLCPKTLRKSVYRIHTQPLVLVAMVMLLTIGHLIVD